MPGSSRTALYSAGDYTPATIQGKRRGKSDGPRFASRSCRAQSFRIWRARRRLGRSRERRVRSARLCQSRTESPQRRVARDTRTAIDPGTGRSGVRLSARGQAGARCGREIGRTCVRGQSSTAGAGRQGAKAQPFAQQHRDGYRRKRSRDEAAGQRQRGDAIGRYNAVRCHAAERDAAWRHAA